MLSVLAAGEPAPVPAITPLRVAADLARIMNLAPFSIQVWPPPFKYSVVQPSDGATASTGIRGHRLRVCRCERRVLRGPVRAAAGRQDGVAPARDAATGASLRARHRPSFCVAKRRCSAQDGTVGPSAPALIAELARPASTTSSLTTLTLHVDDGDSRLTLSVTVPSGTDNERVADVDGTFAGLGGARPAARGWRAVPATVADKADSFELTFGDITAACGSVAMPFGEHRAGALSMCE
jgi:hypothetical protein